MDSGQVLPSLPLPPGIECRYIRVDDIIMHFLDAKPNPDVTKGEPPLLLLLHGFPEIAFSWRKVMVPLAELGFRVVAPDQRGFGRTIPIDNGVDYPYTYTGSLKPFDLTSAWKDVLGFVFALGYKSVSCVIGHDMGSTIAAFCTIARPDVFKALIMMSSPFSAVPNVPDAAVSYDSLQSALRSANAALEKEKQVLHPGLAIDAMLANMEPPRMHYQHYYCLPIANEQMHRDIDKDDLRRFLRTYYHVKSACWPSDATPAVKPSFGKPQPLKDFLPPQVDLIPPYYIMLRGKSMPDDLAEYEPTGKDLEKSQQWLPEVDLAVYVEEYARTSFQGGLNRYRIMSGLGKATDTASSISKSDESHTGILATIAGKTIDVPAMFVSGEKDWGPYQFPGSLAKMRSTCVRMRDEDVRFISRAGHWAQQENPEELLDVLKAFLRKVRE